MADLTRIVVVVVACLLCFCFGIFMGSVAENMSIGKNVDDARALLARAEAWAAYQKALKNPKVNQP